MISKLLVFLFIVLANIGFSQNTSIPDTIFEKYLIYHGFDTGSVDGVVPTANLSTVYVLFLGNSGVSSLQGIQDMTNLVYLDCSNNNLTTLDLSNNQKLVNVLCPQNKISTLTVGENIKLTGIYAPFNQISNIDVSLCPNITSLEFRQNNLSSIQIENLAQLLNLGISRNNLSSINVSKNSKLKRLDCSNNNITVLNVASNLLLDSLVCDTNNLTKLNLSNLKNLRTMRCHFNQIDGTLDLSNNIFLKDFSCYNNLIDVVNLENCTSLERIFVGNNQLTSLDISSCPKAYFVDFCYNDLHYLNLKNGNNINFYNTPCLWGNPSLTCVEVDDPQYATNHWPKPNTINYNVNCNASIQNINACNSYKWINDTTYTTSTNSPIYTIKNGASNGSDSTIYLNLNIQSNNTNVSISNNSLTANQPDVAYQWVNCSANNAFITGETQKSFSPINEGSYAVILKNGSCVDTSACYTILGVDENTSNQASFSIYPNPNQGKFTIQLNSTDFENSQVSFFNLYGELIQNKLLTFEIVGNNKMEIQMNQLLAEGVYFVQIMQQNHIKYIQKLIVTNK